MSIPLHIDSRWRQRSNEDNLNPAEFFISAEVVQKWQSVDRTVQAVRPHDKMQVTNMVHSVKLLNLTVPYDFGGAVGATFNNIAPFVYVNLQSTSMYKDMRLVNTLEDGRVVNQGPDILGANTKTSLKDVTFVAYCDKVQGTGPNWIQYKCGMTQTYRLKLDDALTFRVFTGDGKTLPIVDNAPPDDIDPTKQVNALFEITPYVREDRYDNHLVTLYNSDA